jgi:hypothetical protein
MVMVETKSTHRDLHSEQGALPGEHSGRSRNPVIKIVDLAWLEFEKPDLARTEAFARAFGFQPLRRGPDEIQLRGTLAGAPCVIVRRGPRTRFAGAAFRAGDEADVLRLADKSGAHTRALPETIGGLSVDLVDPGGMPVRVLAGMHELAELPDQQPHIFNFGHDAPRANTVQRPPRVPARVQRLGHLVVQSTKYLETLNWYLDNLGMIVSDFQFFPGQREQGPTMSFIRCDRGSTPARWRWRWVRPTATSTPRIRSATSTLWPPAANTSGSGDISGPGESAGTSRAVRSSTTGAIPMASWSSTSPTVTCSTTPSNPVGRP